MTRDQVEIVFIAAAWAGGAESMKPPDCRRHSSA